MAKLKKVYVAHTFSERHFVRDQLCPFLHKVGIVTVNPFYNADGTIPDCRPEVKLADEMESQGVNPRDNTSWSRAVKRKSEDIVSNDLKLIDETDGIVAWMQEWSGGTTCISMDTQILTINGWKGYNDVKNGDIVVGLNLNSGLLELTEVLAKKITKSKMVEFKSRTVDMKVSIDHQVLFKYFNSRKNEWSILNKRMAKELIGKWWIKIPCGAKVDRSCYIEFSDDEICLLGWCLTEGHYSTKIRNNRKSGIDSRITITQSKNHVEYCNEIRNTLNNLKINFSEYEQYSTAPNGKSFLCIRFRFHSKQINPLITSNWKRIPKSILFGCKYNQLQLLFDTIMKGDGTISRKMIGEPSKDLIEDYQILAIMLGKRTNLRAFDGHIYKLYFSNKPDAMVRKPSKISEGEEDVWCIQTGLGTFIARRNGKPFITHNCEIFYAGHVHKKSVYLITSNTKISIHPWIVDACRYGRIFKSYAHFKKWMRKHYRNEVKQNVKQETQTSEAETA